MSIVWLLGRDNCLLKVPLNGRLRRLLSGLKGRAGVICNATKSFEIATILCKVIQITRQSHCVIVGNVLPPVTNNQLVATHHAFWGGGGGGQGGLYVYRRTVWRGSPWMDRTEEWGGGGICGDHPTFVRWTHTCENIISSYSKDAGGSYELSSINLLPINTCSLSSMTMLPCEDLLPSERVLLVVL